MGVLVYFILLSGFFSISKFAILGSLRSSSQRISFEIIFFFILFCFLIFFQSFFFKWVTNILLFTLIFLFVILVLVELNRAPFDFSEGERELVSGFNLEFGTVFFILLFLREYGFLIFFRVLTRIFFIGNLIIFIFIIFSIYLLIRSSYPRYRYDLLIIFFWLGLLPFTILVFL